MCVCVRAFAGVSAPASLDFLFGRCVFCGWIGANVCARACVGKCSCDSLSVFGIRCFIFEILEYDLFSLYVSI